MRIPIIGSRLTIDQYPSGLWHYAQPCGHRLQLSESIPISPAATVAPKYNAGPLWKDGYVWQNIHWGKHFETTLGINWARKVDRAVANIEADRSYSGGLRQFNVGVGRVTNAIIISENPPPIISNEQVQMTLVEWIKNARVPDLHRTGAYNIFLPPGVTVSLSSDLSCAQFCDYHDSVDGPNGPFYTVEPYPCNQGCNQCTSNPFDTLTQGLSEELCVPATEVLLGDNKPIALYNIGDAVVGAKGIDTVTGKITREYDGELVRVNAYGMLPLVCTPNHPILTIKGSIQGSQDRPIVYSPPEWLKAGELPEKHQRTSGIHLLLPVIEGSLDTQTLSLEKYSDGAHKKSATSNSSGVPTQLPLNSDTAWFLGVFVAEGSASSNNVSLSLHEKKTHIALRVKKIMSSIGYKTTITSKDAIRICIGSAQLSSFIQDQCGKGVLNRRIPDFLLYHKDSRLLQAFLDGYLSGDRYYHKKTIVETVSKMLALQLQLAFAIRGKMLALKIEKSGRILSKIGRRRIIHDSYNGQIIETPKARRHGEFFAMPITSIQRLKYKGKVANIETLSHTYVVSNAIVHNCELKTDMDPGSGWVIGNLELCDFCDEHFVCNRISTGEYVNAWYDAGKAACWIGR